MSQRRGSLRRRLTLGVLLLVVSVLSAVTAATALALRGFLADRLDEQLVQTAAQAATRSLTDLRGVAESTLLVQLTPTGRLARPPVLVVGRGRDDRGAQLSTTDLQSLASSTSAPSTVHLSDLGTYRTVAQPDADGHRTVVAMSLRPVDQTVGRLLLVELVALLVAAVVVAVVGRTFIRRELRPLADVAATARRVTALPLSASPNRLDERVHVPDAPAEVADVADALDGMLAHVDQALEARASSEQRLRAFVADASHELRTPLVSIRGYAELAGRPDVDDEQRNIAVSRIEAEASRMGALVDDLLLLARLDQGRALLREPVDLTRLVAEVTADTSVASPQHPIRLDLPTDPVVVTGDRDRLRQVLVNLLDNATRHTPPGTTVTVAVHGPTPDNPEPEPHLAQLVVFDDGPGVPKELQATVFERFSRGEGSRSRATGGSGLGLSIVRAVVTASGGSVELASRPGQTAVTVHLPQPG